MTNEELLELIDRAARDDVRELDLSMQELRWLPPEIGNLTNLQTFDLNDNQLTELPPEIGKLTNLQWLDLHSNQLTEIPTEIGNLTNLQTLVISDNQLTKLPAEIGKLINLQTLVLYHNQLTELPPEIGKLANLEKLDPSSNQLTELPTEIGKLTNLRFLYLAGNQLTELPLGIVKLTDLRELYLRHNQLTELPPEIGRLTTLRKLELWDNQLTALPTEMENLTELGWLDLRDNPLQEMPPEILEKVDEPSVTLTYYFEHVKGERRPLNEAKMVLVGQPAVGKTSLAKGLLGEQFNPQEETTRGIDIREWRLPVSEDEIRVNVWDFGGQEIMHATHQFFFTKRTLYLLVLDARVEESDNRLDYWLRMIQSFGADSPILIVVNKCDVRHRDIDLERYRGKYPDANIKDLVHTSCFSGDGIQKLRECIESEIDSLPFVHSEFLVSWFAVKEKLEKMTADYIPYSKYEEMCGEEQVNETASQETLIGFLHDLGIVLKMDDPELSDTNVLNPEWLTKAVYALLNDAQIALNQGILEWEALSSILAPLGYEPPTYRFITGMMKRFELCFRFEDVSPPRFLIPDLLPNKELHTGEWDDPLRFEYRYPVLPASVISTFIVRMHHQVCENTYWRTGVLLDFATTWSTRETLGNQALVKADLDDGLITIWIRGNESTRRETLGRIREQLESIHKKIPNLEWKEWVPIPGHPDKAVSYEHLLQLEEMGEETHVVEGLREKIPIKTLLQGIRQRQPAPVREVEPAPPSRPDEKPEPSIRRLAGVLLTLLGGIGITMFLIKSIAGLTGTLLVAASVIVFFAIMATVLTFLKIISPKTFAQIIETLSGLILKKSPE